MTRVAIIGTGLIGQSWAILHAIAGNDVHLWDGAAGVARAAAERIASQAGALADSGLFDPAATAGLSRRITACDTLAQACGEADFVQENTSERLEVKRAVFRDLDAAAPATAILASSTSGLLPSHFTDGLPGRDRCLVVHPLNPPHLVPAVEVVPAPWTRPDVVTQTAAMLRALGKSPIVMQREIDGFVMNRLQGAILEEAFRLIEGGHAGAEDIDAALRDGLALRWSVMGPMETMDLNAPGGVRDYVARFDAMYATIHQGAGRRADWTGVALDRIEAARRSRLPLAGFPARQAWRDRRLAALLRHLQTADRDPPRPSTPEGTPT
ncbi:MAG: 3-hydroxyacyl-CoA dehydrogenase [Paracoccaceae bacterium]